MRRTFLLLLFLTVLAMTSADAHSVKWINGKTYDYTVLLNGRDCCGGTECRPAFWHKPNAQGWFLLVPEKGVNPNLDPGEAKRISVGEAKVTYIDLAGDGVAHACGSFDERGQWSSYCTFIPRASTAGLSAPLKHLWHLIQQGLGSSAAAAGR